MEGGLEELRILQTIILLITTSNIVHGECLGKVSHSYVFPFRILMDSNCQPVSSVGRAPDCRAGGRGFKPRPDQHSGSLNN